MKTNFYVTLGMIAGLMFFSCGKGKSNDQSGKNDSLTVQQNTPPSPKTVQLKCKSKGVDEFENPQNDVILSVDGKDTVIARILSCEEITKEQYKDMQIPAEATTACGGWWAGGGDYFYAYIKDGKVKVFRGWQDEGQEDEGYHWEEMDLTKTAKK